MKTLDQILEDVTAGGQWKLGKNGYILWEADELFLMVGRLDIKADAAYAAWAARHAPALFRALDLMIYAPDSAEAMRVARNAMAEALKD